MCVVICCTLANPVKVVISALQRAVFWQLAQMPFAYERGAVACLLQQRRQGGSVRRQTYFALGQRLVQTDREPILVAAGDEGSAGCRTNRGIGISLQEAHTFCSQVIDIRSAEVG